MIMLRLANGKFRNNNRNEAFFFTKENVLIRFDQNDDNLCTE